MDRTIVYPGSIPLVEDVLQTEQNTMIALGYSLQAHVGQNTVFFGLPCQPTAPASMQVTIGSGAVIAPNVIEATPFGLLPADTSDALVKMGINIASTTFPLTAPTTPGQSQNYMIQGSFSESDDSPATLTYFNSLNANQPFSGPANSGTPQNTRRAQRCNLQIKPGTPANTGTQVTPPVDTGWFGLYVITANFGQTAITSSAISTYPGAPFLAAFLSGHHGGVPGQAPKIDLANEVQGILGLANLPTGVGSNLSFAGNPNTHVAGTAAVGSSPPSICWDTVDDVWWTCITTGTTSAAVWISPSNSRNLQTFTTSGTFTVPVGITKVKVTVVGAGGAGGSATTTAASAGGSAGGAAIKIVAVSPGALIPITIGSGGAPALGSTGGTGGTSSFGSIFSATGGQGGIQGNGSLTAGQASGSGVGGDINFNGGSGSDGFASGTAGAGGNSIFGGAGRGGSASNATTMQGQAPGAGGGGTYATANILGGQGAAGIVIVEY